MTPPGPAAPAPRREQDQAADCLTCRVVGVTVCGACAAYLAGSLHSAPPANRAHRIGLAAGTLLFSGLALARAFA